VVARRDNLSIILLIAFKTEYILNKFRDRIGNIYKYDFFEIKLLDYYIIIYNRTFHFHDAKSFMRRTIS